MYPGAEDEEAVVVNVRVTVGSERGHVPSLESVCFTEDPVYLVVHCQSEVHTPGDSGDRDGVGEGPGPLQIKGPWEEQLELGLGEERVATWSVYYLVGVTGRYRLVTSPSERLGR